VKGRCSTCLVAIVMAPRTVCFDCYLITSGLAQWADNWRFEVAKRREATKAARQAAKLQRKSGDEQPARDGTPGEQSSPGQPFTGDQPNGPEE
jgi:hypothetical protein